MDNRIRGWPMSKALNWILPACSHLSDNNNNNHDNRGTIENEQSETTKGDKLMLNLTNSL